jgi:hypothetical protein
MSDAQVTSVDIRVEKIPDGDCSMVMSYDKKKPIEKKYESWAEASRQAAAIAHRTGLDSISVLFHLPDGVRKFEVEVPNVDKGERIGPAIVVVERRLERLGFECNYITGGKWVIHRPDPAGGYNRRGYFSAAEMVTLGASDSEGVDEAISQSSSGSNPRSMDKYMRLNRGDSMAAKAGKASKKAADKPAKEVVTVKVDGKEVSLSPKQAEVYEQIKSRSNSGSPLGSDDERLSDPDSIAAMKLATELGVVQRTKVGSRWHYFATKGDMDKAIKAHEKEAADAAAIKAASKRPAKTEAPKAKSAAAGAATASGKKKSGPLKKPSEK